MKENPVVAPVTDGADVADVTSERGVTLKTPLVLGNKKNHVCGNHACCTAGRFTARAVTA